MTAIWIPPINLPPPAPANLRALAGPTEDFSGCAGKPPRGGSLAPLIQASITEPKDDRYCNLILLPPHVAFLFLTSTNVKIKISDFPSGPRGFSCARTAGSKRAPSRAEPRPFFKTKQCLRPDAGPQWWRKFSEARE